MRRSKKMRPHRRASDTRMGWDRPLTPYAAPGGAGRRMILLLKTIPPLLIWEMYI